MIINQSIYPYTAQVQNLPFFLTGIGGSEYQCHIKRENGYYCHQIFFVAKGKGILKFDNQTFELSDGTFFFMPGNYPHEYEPLEEKWDVRWFSFDGSGCTKLFQEFNFTKPFILKPDDSHALQKMYNEILYTIKTDKVYGEYSCSALVYQYLIKLHNLILDENKSNGKDKSQILLPVLLYIDNNFNHDFPLTDLSNISGITPQHLCRLFKETLHMKPSDYLKMRRINEAKQLLETSNFSINEIAKKTGFSSVGYFCTVFHQTEGQSANNFRKTINQAKI